MPRIILRRAQRAEQCAEIAGASAGAALRMCGVGRNRFGQGRLKRPCTPRIAGVRPEPIAASSGGQSAGVGRWNAAPMMGAPLEHPSSGTQTRPRAHEHHSHLAAPRAAAPSATSLHRFQRSQLLKRRPPTSLDSIWPRPPMPPSSAWTKRAPSRPSNVSIRYSRSLRDGLSVIGSSISVTAPSPFMPPSGQQRPAHRQARLAATPAWSLSALHQEVVATQPNERGDPYHRRQPLRPQNQARGSLPCRQSKRIAAFTPPLIVPGSIRSKTGSPKSSAT